MVYTPVESNFGSSLLVLCFFLRWAKINTVKAPRASAPKVIPTAIPTFVPVERPEDECGMPVVIVLVVAEVDVAKVDDAKVDIADVDGVEVTGDDVDGGPML